MTGRKPLDENVGRDRLVEATLRAGRRRERLRIAGFVALASITAGAVILTVVLLQRGGDSGDLDTSGEGALPFEVAEYDDLSSVHVTTPVDYDQSPPVGGPHNPIWLNCGTYPNPIPNENVVHSMEHGAVWITYVPTLEDAQVVALEAITPSTFAVLSPYADQASPIVVSAWGRQMEADSARDPRISDFISEYRLGGVAPEPGASCDGASDGTIPLDGG
ncbi:DUF3105 domain-containing protein [Nocardioides sp.]|jgi:hypothetical protein|uniref:DUF3105 domain-containing protein n=1 Tax=Nocardioides sp. TaxID=35761 RepID=UPI000C8E4A09|nr:DUF3105 domain-containing protein [Nocardioides sp.]MAS53408.1 hypothetical protein [Pimelobacter sp.]MBU1803009.1 DUF3105 domain-containing protein [Actinomycetota bacterium]MDE0776531.1 DUF3105 domain-containing protein [Nocardioides sp.]